MQKRILQISTVSLVSFLLFLLTALTSFSAFAASTNTKTSPKVSDAHISHPYSVTNPYSPAYQHPYRHGAVPTIPQLHKINAYAQSHANAQATTSANTVSFGGGIDGIGVTSSTPKVYLVFWGNQWGTQSTNSSGNLTFSNDTAGAASYIQNLFKGLGTGGELWSGTMTQYCDGPHVAIGATTCATSDPHIGYPTNGVLAGVWYDNSIAEPFAVNGNQLATEAVKAAGHFGNTTILSNRYSQYVIFSPSGNDPDDYEGNYCAWHDYNADTTLTGGAATSPYGDIAFTNLPYILDTGDSCGENFLNTGSAGTLDGFSIVEGHEYAETLTDQNPAGGWTNPGAAGGIGGDEVGDECAWIFPGEQGAVANVTTAKGTFAMQSIWSNDTDECDISHPIVKGGPPPNDFVLTSNPTNFLVVPGKSNTATITTTVISGLPETVQLAASISPSGPTLSLNSTSITAGNSSTLTISVASSVALNTSYTITIKATEGSTSHTLALTVTTNSTTVGGIINGGFETGSFGGWTINGPNTISTTTVHSGKYSAQVGEQDLLIADSNIQQTFLVPPGASTLSFWYVMSCPLTADWATATLLDNTTNTTTTILPQICNPSTKFTKVSAKVTAGHSYTLTLSNHYTLAESNDTYYDDVTLS